MCRLTLLQRPFCYHPLHLHRPPHPLATLTTHARRPMESAKKGEREDGSASLRIDPEWYVRRMSHRLHRSSPSKSFRDALRTFFQPAKTDDPRLDFYTVYKKEATEYDTDYVKKYDEDLNTTLIFVRHSSCALTNNLTSSRRRAFSLPSALLSSSTYIQSSNQTPTINQQPSSVPSFSPSITPRSQTKPPLFQPSSRTLPARSSPSLVSCTQAF